MYKPAFTNNTFMLIFIATCYMKSILILLGTTIKTSIVQLNFLGGAMEAQFIGMVYMLFSGL